MVGTAIVALPPVDDLVNKVSSEKEAHLTLLFLGEASLSDEAILYVQHACSQLEPLWLSVDYRGTLGAEGADVLFFKKDAWDFRRVNQLRHHLLLNDEIKKAYDSTEQFPEWTPHLTLGYPASPAHELEDDRRITYVDFDRVAVWTGEFEGPEFRLEADNRTQEVAMSDISTAARGKEAAEELFHYGVKGMKWGVRNDRGHEGERVKTKKLAKLDKKWEKENTGQRGYFKAHNAMAERMNNGMIDDFNNSPKWKDVDLNKNPEREDEYMDDFMALSNKVFHEETVKLGMNPSGTKAYEMREDEDGNPYAYLAPVKKDVQHAEGDIELVFKIGRDAKGKITSLTETELELKHYGVKGMKWGVRKSDRAPSTSQQEVTITQKKPGTFAKSKGGKGLPISEDAKAALETRQKARASTTDALSNKELQQLVTRMNLEQQYNNLAFQSDRRSKGARFVQGLLGVKRYGKKRPFSDFSEEQGDMVRKALENEKVRNTTKEVLDLNAGLKRIANA